LEMLCFYAHLPIERYIPYAEEKGKTDYSQAAPEKPWRQFSRFRIGCPGLKNAAIKRIGVPDHGGHLFIDAGNYIAISAFRHGEFQGYRGKTDGRDRYGIFASKFFAEGIDADSRVGFASGDRLHHFPIVLCINYIAIDIEGFYVVDKTCSKDASSHARHAPAFQIENRVKGKLFPGKEHAAIDVDGIPIKIVDLESFVRQTHGRKQVNFTLLETDQ